MVVLYFVAASASIVLTQVNDVCGCCACLQTGGRQQLVLSGLSDPVCTLQILVAGSEATLDYRVQIYTPAYLQTGNPRPTLAGAPGSLTYGQTFSVNFGGVTTIDRAVLVRQSAVTHSIHMDARTVALVIGSAAGGTLTLTAPPDATIAPPGYYMLFIMYGGVPSTANWVHVG